MYSAPYFLKLCMLCVDLAVKKPLFFRQHPIKEKKLDIYKMYINNLSSRETRQQAQEKSSHYKYRLQENV
jgi:predicted RNA-binding protein YlxR (DUF448 family)